MTDVHATGAITFRTDEWYLDEIARLVAAHQISQKAYAELEHLSLPEQLEALTMAADIRSMLMEAKRAQKH